MTVNQLIEALKKIEDKSLPVYLVGNDEYCNEIYNVDKVELEESSNSIIIQGW